MPRPTKGPRLYLRPAAEQRRARPCYVIRDGRREISTGCGPDQQREAERALASHIASKLALPPADPDRRQDPTRVVVREVLSLYATERAPELAVDQASMDGWIAHLRAWWGDRTLSHVRRSTCKAYVADRTRETALVGGRRTSRPVSDQTARRELEVLSAAIGYWDAEDRLLYRPTVWLPPKAETRRNALSRAEVAALLKATLGWRLEPDGRWTRLSSSALRPSPHSPNQQQRDRLRALSGRQFSLVVAAQDRSLRHTAPFAGLGPLPCDIQSWRVMHSALVKIGPPRTAKSRRAKKQ